MPRMLQESKLDRHGLGGLLGGIAGGRSNL